MHLVSDVENFINFAHDVQDGEILKSAEKMPILDAIAFIDESFNYEYCFHTAGYGDIIEQTIEVIMPIIVSESKTYTVDAAIGYNDAVTEIRAKYKNILDEDKVLLGISVKNLGLYNSNSIKLEVTGQIGTGEPSFREEDPEYSLDFWWLLDSYNCDQTLSDFGGAPNIIQGELLFLWSPAPQPNTRIWFTGSQNYIYADPTLYDNPNDVTIDNYCDYCLFYATARLGNIDNYTVKCLTGEGVNNEIDTYIAGANSLIQTKITSTSLDYQSVLYSSVPGNDENFATIEHHMKLTLGIKHISQWSTQYPICID